MNRASKVSDRSHVLHLQDAQPYAWRGDKKPDPSPAELRLGTAAKRWVHADDALEAWVREGRPVPSPEWERLIALRDLRWEEFLHAWWGFPTGDGRQERALA